MRGLVFNIQRFAIHDGPGIRTTVFMKGCPLSCWWCHNPEGISPGVELMWVKYKCIRCGTCVVSCPNQALSFDGNALILEKAKCTVCEKCVQLCPTTALKSIGRWMKVEDLVMELKKDLMYFDHSGGGVTFSGGEPLFQIDFLLEALPEIKSHGIHVTIDTSGYVDRENLERLMPYVDLFLYDLKVIDEDKHIKNTGVSNDVIKDNLKFLVRKRKRVIIRIPVIPGVNDSQVDVDDLCCFLSSLDSGLELNLLPYHNVSEKYTALWKKFAKNKTQDISSSDVNNSVEFVKNQLQSNGFRVKIGG